MHETDDASAAQVSRSAAEVAVMGHIACEHVDEEIDAALRERYGADIEVLSSPATPEIATRAGAGAWGLDWLGDDT